MGAAEFPRSGLAEAIEHLGTMPAFVAAAIDVARGEELKFRPGEGEFSLTEQACHLRDLERAGYLVRAKRILGEDSPTLATFDGAAVAAASDYHAQDARTAARDFAQARRELTTLLSALDASQLKRTAVFEGKRITLEDLVAMILEHDTGHREEIEAIVDALSAD
jgi:hypothetical protein